MRHVDRSAVVVSSLLASLAMMTPREAEAQGAVGIAPGIGTASDGIGLGVTPVVSADRRYVRVSLDFGNSTIDGFQNFSVPFAVSGANGTGGGPRGGAGAGAGLGGNLGGFRSVGPGLGDPLAWHPDFSALDEVAPMPARPVVPKKPRPRKDYPEPYIRPSKKPVPAPRG